MSLFCQVDFAFMWWNEESHTHFQSGRERILSHRSINLDLKAIIYQAPDIQKDHTHFKIFLGDCPNINFIVEYCFVLMLCLAKTFQTSFWSNFILTVSE